MSGPGEYLGPASSGLAFRSGNGDGKRLLVVYSSVTGNTRRVAEAVAGEAGCGLAPVADAPDPADLDLLLLGFWVRRGRPDGRMLDYMDRIRGKNIALFGTLGAWPDSEHARACAQSAANIMEMRGNRVLGVFLCQGRVDPRLLERLPERVRAAHPLTEERRRRHAEAARHPDAQDLELARAFVRRCLAGETPESLFSYSQAGREG